MLKNTYIILISTLLVVSCGGVTDQDITRACAKVGSSPQYLALSTFTDEYYKLEDMARSRSSASAWSLDYKLESIKFDATTYGSFQRACVKQLKKDFSI